METQFDNTSEILVGIKEVKAGQDALRKEVKQCQDHLDARVGTLADDLEKMKQCQDHLDARVGTLADDLGKMKQGQDALREEVRKGQDGLRKDLSKLDGRLEDLQDDLRRVRSRVATIEDRTQRHGFTTFKGGRVPLVQISHRRLVNGGIAGLIPDQDF